jgi:hypothetical protein
MKALLYLNLHIFKNILVTTMRNPRQILPVLFIFFIFGFPLVIFFTLYAPSVVSPYTTQTAKPVILSFLLFIIWMSLIESTTKNTLVFSLSEIDFLFPSPLARKTLLLNRMIANYVKLAFLYLGFTAFVLFFFSSLYEFSFWPRIFFLWSAVLLTTIFASNLADAISLVSSHFSEFRRSRNRRIVRILFISLLGILLGYTCWYTRQGVPLLEAAIKVLNSSAIRILMYPAAMASDVAVAWRLTAEIGVKTLILAALCLITTLGVLSVEAHFYESSEAAAREKWESVQKIKSQKVMVSESFIKKMRKIQPFGRGSTALIWKNLVGLLRDIKNLMPTVLMAVLLFVIMATREGEFNFFRAVFFFVMLVFIATGYIRWDFREDLRRIEIIKLVPDSNFKITLSEIAVPVLFSTFISYIFLAISFPLIPDTGQKALQIGFTLAAIPVFSVIIAAILNLSVLYYPPQTNNQVIPGILSLIFIGAVLGPSLVLGILFSFLGKLEMGLLLILFLNIGVAIILLKLLARKYQFFDLSN